MIRLYPRDHHLDHKVHKVHIEHIEHIEHSYCHVGLENKITNFKSESESESE